MRILVQARYSRLQAYQSWFLLYIEGDKAMTLDKVWPSYLTLFELLCQNETDDMDLLDGGGKYHQVENIYILYRNKINLLFTVMKNTNDDNHDLNK